MTHIENIPHVLEHGVTHRSSPNSNPNYVPIGDGSLISTRDDYEIPNGNLLGDYIPFYFGLRTPMLYVIQNGYNGVTALHPSKIVYCVSNVQKIIDAEVEFIYTDGHATDSFTDFYDSENVVDIADNVDFNATKAKYWKNDDDLDLKRRKEAEFLIRGDLAITDLIGYITYNDNARESLIGFGVSDEMVVVRPNLFF